MKKISSIYVEDMIEAIDLVTSYVKGVPEVDFSRDQKLQDAVIRRLAVIGEAANKLKKDIKNLAPDIPWHTIIGFRNVVIHDYSGISMGLVWKIMQRDLPALEPQLKILLNKLLVIEKEY